MAAKIIVCLFAILVALGVSALLVYVNKFKKYIVVEKRQRNFWLYGFDILWRIALPVLFGFAAIWFPVKIIWFFVEDISLMKKLGSYYLCSFVPTFFVFMYILMKMGIIKTTNRLQ